MKTALMGTSPARTTAAILLLGWSVFAACAGQARAQQPPEVSDPILTPPPPASREVKPWAEAVEQARTQQQPKEVPDREARRAAVTDPMLTPPPPAAHEVKSWDEALELIRRHSPDYISGYQTILRAAAQSRMALAAVLPTLSGQLSYTHQFNTLSIPFDNMVLVSPAKDVWAATGNFQWNIGPRAIYAVGTADRNTQIASLSFKDRRRTIATMVVSSMLATLATSRVAQLNRVGLRAALDRLELTKARLQYAQGTALDVDRAQQDLAATRALIITSDESLRQAREALGEALGSSVPFSAPADLALAEFGSEVERTCHLNDDIEKRPDILAARRRVEVAERTVHDAELLLAPSLALSSQAQAASASVLGPLNTWSVTAALNIPLYDGGYRYGLRRDSRAALEQARQSLVSAQLAAAVAAAQAHRGVAVAEASRDVAQQQRDLAARIDQRTRDGYRQGAGTSLDLVTSAQSLRQAEINLVIAQVQVGQARANSVLTNAECVY